MGGIEVRAHSQDSSHTLTMPPNPTSWDQEFAFWDQPAGAQWDFSPPEPPPKPKKKPFHRAPKNQHPNPPTPTIMSDTFKYNVAPLAGGGFTTRAVRGIQADEASLTAAIAAATSVDPLKIPLVI